MPSLFKRVSCSEHRATRSSIRGYSYFSRMQFISFIVLRLISPLERTPGMLSACHACLPSCRMEPKSTSLQIVCKSSAVTLPCSLSRITFCCSEEGSETSECSSLQILPSDQPVSNLTSLTYITRDATPTPPSLSPSDGLF